VRVVWTHFPLHPETPAEGQSLEELFAGRNVDRAAMQTRMQGLMAQEGLPYGQRTKTYNSRLAQELGKWADTQPNGARIHDALFRAYFVDGKNIGQIDTLVEIAEAVGLSGTAARHVLTSRQFESAIDADWERSRAFGITGVPTFVANGRGVVGAQPYEVLERLVQLAGGQRRTQQDAK
jgi:predicted DsbA family dithiol-disulfide isomerase